MHRLILLPGTGVRASQTYGGVGRDIDAQTDPPPRYRGQSQPDIWRGGQGHRCTDLPSTQNSGTETGTD